MSRRSFEDGLEFGRRGERLVEAWLQEIGFATMPAYDFVGHGAPQIRRADLRVAVPDILGMKSGKSFWFEVKTHEQSFENKKRGCRIHGVKERHWGGYKSVAAESGLPVHLLVLELDTGDLLSARVDGPRAIETWPCECRPCRGGATHACHGRQEVYFKRSDMRLLHTFSSAHCDAVRGEVEAA